MLKPWFKSTAILGVITAAIGYVSDPRVLDVLRVLPIPEATRATVAGVITAVGAIGAVFGLRRAIPDATILQSSSGAVTVHDPSGLIAADLTSPRNQYGETPAQEAKRLAIMGAAGKELEDTLRAQGR